MACQCSGGYTTNLKKWAVVKFSKANWLFKMQLYVFVSMPALICNMCRGVDYTVCGDSGGSSYLGFYESCRRLLDKAFGTVKSWASGSLFEAIEALHHAVCFSSKLEIREFGLDRSSSIGTFCSLLKNTWWSWRPLHMHDHNQSHLHEHYQLEWNSSQQNPLQDLVKWVKHKHQDCYYSANMLHALLDKYRHFFPSQSGSEV